MLHILLISLLSLASLHAEVKMVKYEKTSLRKDLKKLFSHETHKNVFSNLKINCQSCHSFNIKSKDPGPLGHPVEKGLIAASEKSCHQCHLQKTVAHPPGQCLLCHSEADQLKPKDHNLQWMKNHAFMARIDNGSCLECHHQSKCSECHFKRDQMNPKVHRGNFRLTHSIDARSNPASCIQCHQSQQFCSQCHSGVRR